MWKDLFTTWSLPLSLPQLLKNQEAAVRGFSKGKGCLAQQEKKADGDIELWW